MSNSVQPHRQHTSHQASPSLRFSRQEHWSGLPFLFPVHESEKWKWGCSVVSDSLRPHGLQPTRLTHPWDFPGKSTRVECHCLLQPVPLPPCFSDSHNSYLQKALIRTAVTVAWLGRFDLTLFKAIIISPGSCSIGMSEIKTLHDFSYWQVVVVMGWEAIHTLKLDLKWYHHRVNLWSPQL